MAPLIRCHFNSRSGKFTSFRRTFQHYTHFFAIYNIYTEIMATFEAQKSHKTKNDSSSPK